LFSKLCFFISAFIPARWRSIVPKGPLRLAFAVLLAAIPVVFASAFISRALAQPHATASHLVEAPDPWTVSQTVAPDVLVKELTAKDQTKRPTVVCVGFRPLYDGAHIPGASFHGAASTPQGIAGLKAWAQEIPRSSNIVLYCGCCPLQHCPNLKPAFAVVRDMGFTKLRVLLLPTDFNTDWIEAGYPVEKGK
jgi:thiosulfate/3-mercaptopyruvate sulfurtransferase